MDRLGSASPVVAAGGGVAVAITTGLAYPAAVALATGVIVTASLCWLLDCRDRAVPAGLACYLAVGAASLIAEVPPGYEAPVGGAVVAAAALGLVAVEVATRAGAVVDAGSPEDAGYGGLWVWPAAALVVPRALWRRGSAGRALVAGLAASPIVVHAVAVWQGTSPSVQAATLVPVALLGFLVFPADDTVSYVSPDPNGSLLHAAGTRAPASRLSLGATIGPRPSIDAPSPTVPESVGNAGRRLRRAPTAVRSAVDAGAGRVRSAGARVRSAGGHVRSAGGRVHTVLPDRDAIGGSDDRDPSGAGDVDDSSSGGGSRSSGGQSTSSGGDARTSGPTSGSAAGTTVVTGGSETESLPACQNCGSEGADRDRRSVISTRDCSVVLCGTCQDGRLDTLRSRSDCHGPEVRGAIGDADACVACGKAGRVLEAHPVVPLENGGHRHPNNVLALCGDCHANVEEHAAAENVAGSTGR